MDAPPHPQHPDQLELNLGDLIAELAQAIREIGGQVR